MSIVDHHGMTLASPGEDERDALRPPEPAVRIADAQTDIQAAMVVANALHLAAGELQQVTARLRAHLESAARHSLAPPSQPWTAGGPAALQNLTMREREVLELIGRGLANKAIAGELHLSVNTVRNVVARLLPKLGARSKLEAAAIAARAGLVA